MKRTPLKRTPFKRKKKKKKPLAKARRKKAKARADRECSLFVRAKFHRDLGGCPFCGSPIEHAFHWIGRRKESVRWDERNVWASCAGCNFSYNRWPNNFIPYLVKNLGQQGYEQLVQDSNTPAKFSPDDLEEIAERFEKKRLALEESI